MLQIIFISTLIVSTFAQLKVSEMPDYKPLANFEISKYTGRWYEVARFPNMYEKYHLCSIVDYTLLNNGTFDIKLNSQHLLLGQGINWDAQGNPINQCSSEMNIHFPLSALKRKTTWALLDTDYENFSVILMIQNAEDSSYLEYVWIMSKKRSVDDKYLNHAKEVLNANHINADELEYIEHDNCPDVN